MRPPITAQGAQRLRAELEELKSVQRPAVINAIAEARAHGDLKENAEYHAAKEEKAKMEARIAQVSEILANATIVEGNDTGTVGSGSIVTLRYTDESDDEAERYLIGSIEERHDDLHVVSPQSPLGEQLMGAKVGDTVSYEAPGGTLSVVVLDIE